MYIVIRMIMQRYVLIYKTNTRIHVHAPVTHIRDHRVASMSAVIWMCTISTYMHADSKCMLMYIYIYIYIYKLALMLILLLMLLLMDVNVDVNVNVNADRC